MPQMAPLSWLTLMMLFISIFLLFNTMNFYSFKYLPYTKTFKIKKTMINWKW